MSLRRVGEEESLQIGGIPINRVHAETVAIAQGVEATTIAAVGVDELRVSTGRAEHPG
jgi:hypothetical protein